MTAKNAVRTEALFAELGTTLYSKQPRPARTKKYNRTPDYEDVRAYQQGRKTNGLATLEPVKVKVKGHRRNRMNSAFRALPLETQKVVDDRHTYTREQRAGGAAKN